MKYYSLVEKLLIFLPKGSIVIEGNKQRHDVQDLNFKISSALDSCVSLGRLSPLSDCLCFHLKIDGNDEDILCGPLEISSFVI
jgi:hypothetical protein